MVFFLKFKNKLNTDQASDNLKTYVADRKWSKVERLLWKDTPSHMSLVPPLTSSLLVPPTSSLLVVSDTPPGMTGEKISSGSAGLKQSNRFHRSQQRMLIWR